MFKEFDGPVKTHFNTNHPIEHYKPITPFASSLCKLEKSNFYYLNGRLCHDSSSSSSASNAKG
jgi:hypothetical protein